MTLDLDILSDPRAHLVFIPLAAFVVVLLTAAAERATGDVARPARPSAPIDQNEAPRPQLGGNPPPRPGEIRPAARSLAATQARPANGIPVSNSWR